VFAVIFHEEVFGWIAEEFDFEFDVVSCAGNYTGLEFFRAAGEKKEQKRDEENQAFHLSLLLCAREWEKIFPYARFVPNQRFRIMFSPENKNNVFRENSNVGERRKMGGGKEICLLRIIWIH